MERAEKIGLGVASAAHVLLFAALSLSWFGRPDPLRLRPEPIEVSIADEVALKSVARKLAETPPPPAPGEIEGPPEKAVQADEPTAPKPDRADPVPDTLPKPEARAQQQPKADPKPAPPAEKKQAQSRGSKLSLDTSDWTKSSTRADARAKPTDGAQASTVGPAQASALAAEIRRQIKPFWKAPTGADADLLRTTVAVDLARDGSLASDPRVIDTTGVTASNSAQVRLHQEQAVKAVRLAAPFNLPPALYEGWKSFSVNVDRKLSQ
ncbi:MAG: cell envelope biogenesis protein TolA [Sphingobium sp.]